MPQAVEVEGVGTVEFPDEFTPDKIKELLDRDFGPKAKAARDIVPAVRKVGGDVAVGEQGDTHPDIIKEHGLTTDDIDQRGFVNKQGQFVDRRTAAAMTGLPTKREPGNLHSTDLPGFEKPAPLPEAFMGRQSLSGPSISTRTTSTLAEPPDLTNIVGQVEGIRQKVDDEGKFVKIPTVPSIEEHPLTPLEAPTVAATAMAFGPKAANVQAQIQRSLLNNVLGLFQFAASEEGVLAGLASLIPVGRLGVEAVFAHDMAKGVLEKAKQLGGDWNKMTTAQKAGAVTDELAAMGMTALIGKGLVKGVGGQVKGAINDPSIQARRLFSPEPVIMGQRIMPTITRDRPMLPKEKLAELEKLAIDKVNAGGQGAKFTDEALSKEGSISETMDNGSVLFSRERFNELVSKRINQGVSPEQAVESVVNQELIHGGARTLEEGDKLAADYYNKLSWVEKKINRRRYLGPNYTGEEPSDSDLGHEAIRFQIERASQMTPLEFLAFTRSEALTSKGLTVLEDVVRSLRKKATKSQEAILDKVRENIDLAKKGVPKDAVEPETAPPVQPVREEPVQGPGKVPPKIPVKKADEGGGPPPVAQETQVPLNAGQAVAGVGQGIVEGLYGGMFERLKAGKYPEIYKSDIGNRIEEEYKAGRIKSPEDIQKFVNQPEPPKAPPTAPTEGAPPPAPGAVKAEAPGAPKAPGAEPTISTPTPKPEESQVPGLNVKEAEDYQRLGSVFGERELTPEEEDRFSELRAKVREAKPPKAGVAARMKATEFEEEIKRRDIRPSTGMANQAGLGMQSVQDLDEYLGLYRRLQKTIMDAVENDDMEKAMRGGYEKQLVREAIETATNAGSNSEATHTSIGKPLGPRPLDWKSHPEVKDWLTKNADQIGIKEDLQRGVAAISKEGEGEEKVEVPPLVSEESKQETEAIPDYAMTSFERMSPEEQENHLSMLVPEGTPEAEANRIYQQFIDSQEAERQELVNVHAADLAESTGEEELTEEEKEDIAKGRAIVQAAFDPIPAKVAHLEAAQDIADQALATRTNSLRRYFANFTFGTKKLKREPTQKLVEGKMMFDIAPGELVPSLKGFVSGMARNKIKVDPATIQWLYLETMWEHLLNASGERLAEWRKALKMEKKYGYGGDESLPGFKRIPDASNWELDKKTGEYRFRMSPEDKEYLLRNFTKEALSKKFGRKVGDKERDERFEKERDKIFRDVEQNQQYRRNLIVNMFERAKKEVLPAEFDPYRKEITADEVAWEDRRDELGKGQIGHYETFDDADAANTDYLESVLDDDARVSSSKSFTFTRRVTAGYNTVTGDWSILSTYRMPDKKGIPGGIMIMDPMKEPGQGKHIRLTELPRSFKIKASMLLKDPVQNFHMRFVDDPKGEIRAKDAYMEEFGHIGRAHEMVSDDMWDRFMQQTTGERTEPKGEVSELGERQKEAPPEGTEWTEDLPATGVEKGEGGSFTGDNALMARLRQNLGDMMRFVIRGPLTHLETDALADILNEHEVHASSDVQTMLEVIQKRSKERTLLGRKRGLTPREYVALMGIDKIAKAKFVELRRRPENKAKYAELMKWMKEEKIEIGTKVKDPITGEMKDPVKEFNENIRMRALQAARLEIYGIADKNRTFHLGKGINIYAETPEGQRPHYNINPVAFSAEALDKFGDRTGRAVEQAKVPAVAPGGKELTMRERVPPTVTRIGYPPGIPRRRALVPTPVLPERPPPERLPPGTIQPPEHLPAPQGAFPTLPTTPSELGGKRFKAETPAIGDPIKTPPGGPKLFEFEKGGIPEKKFIPGQRPPEQEMLRPYTPKGKLSRYQPNLLKEAVDLQKPEEGVAARAKDVEGEDRNLFGISQAARDNRRRLGETDLAFGAGDGVIGEEAVDLAKAEYAKNPIAALEAINDFKKHEQISEKGVAMAWVHSWKMSTSADKLLKTPAYEAAHDRAVKADLVAKNMMNEWHRIGKVSAVVQDVNTGSYTAMDVHITERRGRGFDASEKVKAEKIAKKDKEEEEDLKKGVATIYEVAGVTKVDPKAELLRQQWADELNQKAKDAYARIQARKAAPPAKGPGAKAKAKGPALPKQEMDDYVTYGMDKIMKGIQFRKRWSIEMASELGPQIRPHLDAIWDAANKAIKAEAEKRAPAPMVHELKKAVAQASAIPTRAEVREEYMKVKGKKYGPNLARMLWTQAKLEYLDKGEIDFGKIVGGLAQYNGLSALDVIRGLAATKSLRVVSDAMWVKAAQRRRTISEARNWLKNLEFPGWQRFARKIPRLFFINKIFGHGTVGLITHAGNMAFNPRALKVWIPAWLDMYRFVFSPAKHEAWIQAFTHDPSNRYSFALRYGLAINPLKYTDDYQIQALHKLFSWGIGNRGFDALKTLRLARFNQLWDATPAEYKTAEFAPQMAREYARMVNHATGITMGRAPEWTNWVMFAPKLEGSRWAWMIGDTLKTAKTFKEWNHATPPQRMAAIADFKGKAAVVATYASLLALNQGILSATGSEQEVNWLNPRKGDFWAFKIAGMNLGIVSPMIGIIRLFANLAHAAVGERKKVEELQTRSGEAFEVAGEYIGGKFAPVTQFARNVIFQSDYRGRPMPWSEDRVPAALRRQGIEGYSWGEWLTDQFGPIPVEEAAREIWTAYGMDTVKMRDIFRALITAGFMGTTGARLSEDMSLR